MDSEKSATNSVPSEKKIEIQVSFQPIQPQKAAVNPHVFQPSNNYYPQYGQLFSVTSQN